MSEPTALTDRMSRVQVSSALVEPPIQPGNVGQPLMLQTNAFGLGLAKEAVFFRYDVTIYAHLKNSSRTVYFTKKTNSDSLISDRAEKCVAIINAARADHRTFFRPEEVDLWYDGQSILIASADLLEKLPNELGKAFAVDPKSTRVPDLEEFPTIALDLQKCKLNPTLELTAENLLKHGISSDITSVDRVLLQFLDLAVGQKAIMDPSNFVCFEHGKIYLKAPELAGFRPQDVPPVGDAKTLKIGVQKAVRMIEGPKGRGFSNPSVIVDSKKAAFHDPVDLATKANAITGDRLDGPVHEDNLKRMNNVMRDLFFTTTHLKKNKEYSIKEIVKDNSMELMFSAEDGSKISVFDYFQTKYSITLRYPRAPLVRVVNKERDTYFPMELCVVKPNQRVKISQQTPQQSQRTTKECATAPALRQRNIVIGGKATGVTDAANEHIVKAGIKLYENPITVHGRLLPAPVVQYRGQVNAAEGGRWRIGKTSQFVQPTECKKWGLYVVYSDEHSMRNFSMPQLKQFALRLITECRKRGMRVEAPADLDAVKTVSLRDKLLMCSAHNCQFAFVVSVDGLTNTHDELKLFERETLVLTQDLKLSTVLGIMEGKNQTLENVVMKMNVKLGGHNNAVKLAPTNQDFQRLLSDKRLIIGIATSNPTPADRAHARATGTQPAVVVGCAGNFKKNPEMFIGNFWYEVSYNGKSSADVLCKILKDMLTKYCREHENQNPEQIVIYRAGVGEGVFNDIVDCELPLARRMLNDLTGGAPIDITYIVVCKDHGMRLFNMEINPTGSAPEQNIAPGVVVDTELTHPKFKEFFINSHVTLMGTARTPRYTVVKDDAKMTMDELESLTNGLCYEHQIVTSPTSLPTPLYIASRYAERGRNVLQAHSNVNTSRGSPHSDESSASRMLELTERLAPGSTPLGNVRYNA